MAFDVLFETPGLPRLDLPDAIRSIYGEFGLRQGSVVANFVSSLDGVVALPAVPKSSPLISGGHPADRFLVALLRAAADAVVIGAGTYRQHGGPWTAPTAYPDAAEAFAQLRASERAGPGPTFVVVTRSGNLGPPRPFLRGAVIVTSDATTNDVVGPYVDAGAEVVKLGGDGGIDPRRVVELLFDRGCSRVLTEGGPDLMGDFLRAGVVDELFLTFSPLLLGGGADPAPVGLAGRADLVPVPVRADRLLSVRRSDDYLFVRYLLEKAADRAR